MFVPITTLYLRRLCETQKNSSFIADALIFKKKSVKSCRF